MKDKWESSLSHSSGELKPFRNPLVRTGEERTKSVPIGRTKRPSIDNTLPRDLKQNTQ